MSQFSTDSFVYSTDSFVYVAFCDMISVKMPVKVLMVESHIMIRSVSCFDG